MGADPGLDWAACPTNPAWIGIVPCAASDHVHRFESA